MPSALFVSPHLDDVAFSCGGTVMRLVEEGWRVTVCTVFTASVREPEGFALACQLDKGLAADLDYMALRREEDWHFCEIARVTECVHLPFYEAPHRGYESASELFAGVRADDVIAGAIADAIAPSARECDWVFGPRGLGGHVDHLQVIRAVWELGVESRSLWWADVPYAMRQPFPCGRGSSGRESARDLIVSGGLVERVGIDLERKVVGCAAYGSQVPFQFGSVASMRDELLRFHRVKSGYAESFLRSSEANTSPFQSRTIMRGS